MNFISSLTSSVLVSLPCLCHNLPHLGCWGKETKCLVCIRVRLVVVLGALLRYSLKGSIPGWDIPLDHWIVQVFKYCYKSLLLECLWYTSVRQRKTRILTRFSTATQVSPRKPNYTVVPKHLHVDSKIFIFEYTPNVNYSESELSHEV